MAVIIGLGNKDNRYMGSRHNIGWTVLDYLAHSWSCPPWKQKKLVNSFITSTSISNKTITLAKPITMMNTSGQTVLRLKKFYAIHNQAIWLIHDDLDIPFGDIKISFDRGPAGHNGVSSVISFLKKKNFYRWRVGIGNTKMSGTQSTKNYVLRPFSSVEQKKLKTVLSITQKSLEHAIAKSPEHAMNKYN